MNRYDDILITGSSDGGVVINWPGDCGVIETFGGNFNGQTVKLQKRRDAADTWRDVPDAVLSASTLEIGFTAGVCQLRIIGTGVTSVPVRISKLGIGYRVDIPRT